MSNHDNESISYHTFRDTPSYKSFANRIGELSKSGDVQAMEEAQFQCLMTFSRKILPSDIGDENIMKVRPLLDRLAELDIEVRVTEEDYFWLYGINPDGLVAKFERSTIFLDLVGPNREANYLFDTLCHEAIHSTGHHLLRWKDDKQPQMGQIGNAYTHEEEIAKCGAKMLMKKLGLIEKLVSSNNEAAKKAQQAAEFLLP